MTQPIGSINAYVDSYFRFESDPERYYIFDGTMKDLCNQMLAREALVGTVVEADFGDLDWWDTYQLISAPHDDRCNGFWVTKIDLTQTGRGEAMMAYQQSRLPARKGLKFCVESIKRRTLTLYEIEIRVFDPQQKSNTVEAFKCTWDKLVPENPSDTTGFIEYWANIEQYFGFSNDQHVYLHGLIEAHLKVCIDHDWFGMDVGSKSELIVFETEAGSVFDGAETISTFENGRPSRGKMALDSRPMQPIYDGRTQQRLNGIDKCPNEDENGNRLPLPQSHDLSDFDDEVDPLSEFDEPVPEPTLDDLFG